MGRRGISQNTMVILLVFIAVFLITIVLWREIADAGQQEFTQGQCQASLQLTRATDLGAWCVKVVPTPVPLHCSRRFMTVEDGAVYSSILGKREPVTRNYNASCPAPAPVFPGSCLAHNVVAEEMRECWSTFFNGEMQVFQQVEEGFIGKADTRACFVCSEITVQTEDVVALKHYLEKQHFRSGLNEGMSYYEHLAKNRNALCSQEVAQGGTCWDAFARGVDGKPPLDQNTLKAGETYAVTLLRRGMSTCSEDSGDSGEESPTIVVQVIPTKDIAVHCDTVLA